MDDFKMKKHFGPGGPKCPCCNEYPTKADANRRARARLKVDLIKVVKVDLTD